MQIKVKCIHNRNRIHDFFKNPTRVIVTSFLLIILGGTFLLMMPFSSNSGEITKFSDALFTATSATCVTGLIVVDTALHFSLIGQIIILGLIQIGGLGLVTFATFFNIAVRKKMGLKSLHLAQESVNSESMYNIAKLIKMIIILTFTIELLGALVLCTVFVPQYGADGIFMSIFLAVSAFCNAGFDILGRQGAFSSLVNYSDNPVVLITIASLVIIGGLGFIVWHDLYCYKKTKKLMLHTKIVLLVSCLLIVCGTVLFLIGEWNNPATLKGMSSGDKILNSFFQSVSCRTAGFNTISIENMSGISKMFAIFLMFIGAAPGSTGGGVKVSTFTVLVMTVISIARGRDETIILGRRVDKFVVYKAMAVVSLAMGVVVAATFCIALTTHRGGAVVTDVNALMEATSAFGTVGLSAGVTSIANLASRMILILTMFIGRVGPVSLALSLTIRANKRKNQVMPEGKVIVG